ncbi:MAG: 30S ribosomal protein S20 [Euzebya sp.]
MANIQSQIKRIRQDETRRVRNKSKRTDLKTFVKHFDTAEQSGDKDAAAAAFHEVSRKLDKAASNNIIKKQNAANKKSRMAARLNAM